MKENLNVQRHELKFYISRSDYEYARHMLSELMHKDEYQDDDRGYHIRSLYFDDAADSAVEDKLDGIEFRDKYRIRIYDTDQKWAKLERKRKANNFVKKDSVTISREEVYQMMNGNYDFLRDKKSTDALSIYFDLSRKYFRPVVLIDYVRDVFKIDYNEIRITFDKHIRTTTTDLDIFDPQVDLHPLDRDDLIIMEVKFNVCLPSWFKDFLKFNSGISSAISKYCYGRMDTREYYFADARIR